MRGGSSIRNWVAVTALSAVAFSLPSLAQRRVSAQQEKHPPQSYQPQRPSAGRPVQPRPASRAHIGDWLRRYKDLAADEQEQALQNDPEFRSLPPGQQQRLRQRLQRFSSLPPQVQLRILNRMDTWEHLTPEQKKEALEIRSQMMQLPPDRRRQLRIAVRDLAAMPADQREHIINSDRFKSMFSDQERDMLREATRLPLAPPEGSEGGEGEPQE